jgi:hypothetical protein
LIELAVSGLLLFIVAADTSPVKLTRTTREEFLREFAYELRVEKRRFGLPELVAYAERFAEKRALEMEPLAFLKGYFDVGLLNEVSGSVSFSLPFVEAYLISDKLKNEPNSALRYFNPHEDDFDTYAFDLYCEQGAAPGVVSATIEYAENTIGDCAADTNVFSTKAVKPAALSSPETFIEMLKSMGTAVEKIAAEPSSDGVRLEKQRLIDARETVRRRVGDQKKQDRSCLSEERRQQFQLLDRLSRSGTLLATLIGSGAERLDGTVKVKAAKLLLTSSERFVHYWTENRLEVGYSSLRSELLSDESVNEIIEQFELFEPDREKIRASLAVFLTDQELSALSGPLATVLYRNANYAGVRALKPVLDRVAAENEIEALIRGAWYMEVEAEQGTKVIKGALRDYRGAELFRLVLANHLMWRVFWHHWQLKSRTIFVDIAKSTLRGVGLLSGKEYEKRMLAGHRADQTKIK